MFFGQKDLVTIRNVSYQCKLCGTSFPLEDGKCTQCGLVIPKQEISPDMNKTLIELAVEKSLLSMGHPELQLVISKLQHDYNCTISDCMEHPEYLKTVLSEIFGNCHYDIVNSIDKTLKMTSMEKPITDFLRVITVHV